MWWYVRDKQNNMYYHFTIPNKIIAPLSENILRLLNDLKQKCTEKE